MRKTAPSVVVCTAFVVAWPHALAGQAAASGDAVSAEQLLALRSEAGGETGVWSPDGSRVLLMSGGGLVTVGLEGGYPVRVPVEAGGSGHFLASQEPKWSPDGRWISWIGDKSGGPEIWLYSLEEGREVQLTDLGGRINGYSWSPDGRWVVLSGDRYGNYDIWKVSVPGGEAERLTGDTRYEVLPVWGPGGERVLYVRLDEGWVDHEVVEMPATGGEGRVVVEDTDFFDYQAGGKFGYPLVSPDGDRVMFRSHRSGWINYWVVGRGGGEPRPVAAEEADQTHARWSPDGEWISYTSNRNGTHDLRVVSAGGGEARVVVAPEGMGVVGEPEWSPDGRWLSYTLGTPTRPADLYVVEVESGERRRLTWSTSEGRLEERLVVPEKVSYRSGPYEIPAYLYAPPGAEAGGERYPGILWIHGGPTSQFRDTYQPHVQYFVQRGYVVLMPNIRGSSGYGKAFEDANNGCWGHCDLEDVRAGVEYLKTLSYVDPAAMGIHGTSYGGIMSMTAVAFAPGLFQASIPHAGYADWVEFYHGENELRHIKFLEFEFGPFAENEDVWRRNSAITGVANVTTPVFLVHGEGRYPGSPQSRIFAEALEKHYKLFEYKIYPGETYYVSSRANRRQMLQDMLAFFDRFLKSGTVE